MTSYTGLGCEFLYRHWLVIVVQVLAMGYEFLYRYWFVRCYIGIGFAFLFRIWL